MPWRLPYTAGGHQRPLLEAAISECLNYFHYIGMLYVLSWVICHAKSIASIRIEIRAAEAAWRLRGRQEAAMSECWNNFHYIGMLHIFARVIEYALVDCMH